MAYYIADILIKDFGQCMYIFMKNQNWSNIVI